MILIHPLTCRLLNKLRAAGNMEFSAMLAEEYILIVPLAYIYSPG